MPKSNLVQKVANLREKLITFIDELKNEHHTLSAQQRQKISELTTQLEQSQKNQLNLTIREQAKRKQFFNTLAQISLVILITSTILLSLPMSGLIAPAALTNLFISIAEFAPIFLTILADTCAFTLLHANILTAALSLTILASSAIARFAHSKVQQAEDEIQEVILAAKNNLAQYESSIRDLLSNEALLSLKKLYKQAHTPAEQQKSFLACETTTRESMTRSCSELFDKTHDFLQRGLALIKQKEALPQRESICRHSIIQSEQEDLLSKQKLITQQVRDGVSSLEQSIRSKIMKEQDTLHAQLVDAAHKPLRDQKLFILDEITNRSQMSLTHFEGLDKIIRAEQDQRAIKQNLIQLPRQELNYRWNIDCEQNYFRSQLKKLEQAAARKSYAETETLSRSIIAKSQALQYAQLVHIAHQPWREHQEACKRAEAEAARLRAYEESQRRDQAEATRLRAYENAQRQSSVRTVTNPKAPASAVRDTFMIRMQQKMDTSSTQKTIASAVQSNSIASTATKAAFMSRVNRHF